jgi:tetratricopeptide (TPR) repeat protein
MRKILPTALLLLPLLGGCDSLHARMLAQDGVSLYHKGQVSDAAKKFEEAGKLDPRIPTIQLNLGFASLALYQLAPKSTEGQAAADQALTAFQKYLELRPNEERAKVFLLQTFIDTGRYEQAVAWFKPQIDKNDPEAFGTLGVIASKTGRYEDAKNWYEKRVQAQPDNADARLSLGVLMWDYMHAHVTDLTGPARIAMADAALAHLLESIKLKPKAPGAYTYANLVYRERSLGQVDDEGKRKDLEEAQKLYKQAQELQKGAK